MELGMKKRRCHRVGRGFWDVFVESQYSENGCIFGVADFQREA
jgi:hypothetical protein